MKYICYFLCIAIAFSSCADKRKIRRSRYSEYRKFISERGQLSFKPIPGDKDINIVNNTDLNIDVIFCKKHIPKYYRIISKEVNSLYEDNNFLNLNTHDAVISIRPDYIQIQKKEKDRNLGKKIESFNIFMRVRSKCDTIKSKAYNESDTLVVSRNTSFGTLLIKHTQGCIDTGRNPVVLLRNSKELRINGIGNIRVVERDIDLDGKPELYIFSIYHCSAMIDIYKIYE